MDLCRKTMTYSCPFMYVTKNLQEKFDLKKVNFQFLKMSLQFLFPLLLSK